MKIILRLGITALACFVVSACGGGSSLSGGGDSGIGGTGISFAKGNIASADGLVGEDLSFDNQTRSKGGSAGAVTKERVFMGQTITVQAQESSTSIVQTQETQVDTGNGKFNLGLTREYTNLILRFSTFQRAPILFSVGAVPAGTEVTLSNIRLDFLRGTISVGKLTVIQTADPEPSADVVSAVSNEATPETSQLSVSSGSDGTASGAGSNTGSDTDTANSDNQTNADDASNAGTDNTNDPTGGEDTPSENIDDPFGTITGTPVTPIGTGGTPTGSGGTLTPTTGIEPL